MAVENRFWRSPDLVAQLIPFLDVASTLALATVQPLVLNLIQRRFIWKNLIRRSPISDYDIWGREERNKHVTQLVEILKLVEDSEPLLDLLHAISKEYECTAITNSVQVSCIVHPAGQSGHSRI